MADLKERLKSITDGNPFAHLGDAVYETLYRSIIRLESRRRPRCRKRRWPRCWM